MSTPKYNPRNKQRESIELEAIGPMKAIGQLFGAVGATVKVINRTAVGIERTVDKTFNLVDDAFVGIETYAAGALDDLHADNIIAEVEREIRFDEAVAKANEKRAEHKLRMEANKAK
jgi:hypothetical protein